jgi:TRAP transporter TAXI family solute receptor
MPTMKQRLFLAACTQVHRYTGTDTDTVTFGVGATFVTASTVSEDIIYVITKAVFDNFMCFKRLHPAFANLTEADMISKNISAPLYPGAVKYYKEMGWM